MLLGPAFGLWFVSKDTIKALSYEGREIGKVEKCSSSRLSGSSSRYKKVPVIVRSNGTKLYGTVDEIRFFSECDSLLGKEVEIIFDKNNPDHAKINSFLEMWFLPLVMTIVCFVLYPSFYLGYQKKKAKSLK